MQKHFGPAAALIALALICPGRVISQRLIVPQSASVAETFSIRVEGLSPGQAIVLRGALSDSAGRIWRSHAGFLADSTGSVDLDRQHPVHGSYTSRGTMGLVTSADLVAPEHGRHRYILPVSDTVPLTIHLLAGGQLVDSAIVRLWIQSGAVLKQEVNASDLRGFLYRPRRSGRFPAVLVIGGSEGGISGGEIGSALASHGYSAFVLGYFGIHGLPPELRSIPLEYFETAIEYLRRQPFISGDRIALFGTSKGAEATLLVAAERRDIKAVVAYAPSHVAWSCICQEPSAPSWTSGGIPVPFIPPGTAPTYSPPPGFPMEPATNYMYRLRDRKAERAAAIAVEKIDAPIMLVAGGSDALWPSAYMAQAIMERRRDSPYKSRDVLLMYPEAGHSIRKLYLPSGSTLIAGGRINTGGTSAANAAAQGDAWTRVLRFLGVTLADAGR